MNFKSYNQVDKILDYYSKGADRTVNTTDHSECRLALIEVDSDFHKFSTTALEDIQRELSKTSNGLIVATYQTDEDLLMRIVNTGDRTISINKPCIKFLDKELRNTIAYNCVFKESFPFSILPGTRVDIKFERDPATEENLRNIALTRPGGLVRLVAFVTTIDGMIFASRQF
jgi:hypothetical protein